MDVTELKTDPIGEEEQVVEQSIAYDKAPRPPNAFILYRQHQHESMKAKYPGYRNTALCKSFSLSSYPILIKVSANHWRQMEVGDC